jgi:hypothetical protein
MLQIEATGIEEEEEVEKEEEMYYIPLLSSALLPTLLNFKCPLD